MILHKLACNLVSRDLMLCNQHLVSRDLMLCNQHLVVFRFRSPLWLSLLFMLGVLQLR